MKIDEILSKDSIISNLTGTNKEEILREITDFLQSLGLIKDKETLFNTLMKEKNWGALVLVKM